MSLFIFKSLGSISNYHIVSISISDYLSFKLTNPGLFFIYFLSLSHCYYSFNFNFNNMNRRKHRWLALDLNLGPQDGRRRRNHETMTDALFLIILQSIFYLCFFYLSLYIFVSFYLSVSLPLFLLLTSLSLSLYPLSVTGLLVA